MADASFRDFVVDQLGGVPGLRSRAMFGGWGFYAGDAFFAIAYDGALYFRTDDDTKARYMAAGSSSFRPNERFASDRYWEVPAEVLDDREELAAWATEAVEAARSAARSSRAP